MTTTYAEGRRFAGDRSGLWDGPKAHRPVNVISLPQPAAGGGFTFHPAGAVVTEIVAVTFRLVTAVAVANRIPFVEWRTSDGIPFAISGAPFAQAASLTTDYSFAVDSAQFGAAGAARVGGPLPRLLLDNTTTVVLGVTAVAAADQVSRVALAVREWPVREEQ
jgi:hypothetical protein